MTCTFFEKCLILHYFRISNLFATQKNGGSGSVILLPQFQLLPQWQRLPLQLPNKQLFLRHPSPAATATSPVYPFYIVTLCEQLSDCLLLPKNPLHPLKHGDCPMKSSQPSKRKGNNCLKVMTLYSAPTYMILSRVYATTLFILYSQLQGSRYRQDSAPGSLWPSKEKGRGSNVQGQYRDG